MNSPRIKILGVGACGCNDLQVLRKHFPEITMVAIDSAGNHKAITPTPFISLAADQRELGAGGHIGIGERLVRSKHHQLVQLLANCDLLFVTGGLGGGTGTALARFLGEASARRGLPCIGLFTLPSSAEGRLRSAVADSGLLDAGQTYAAICTFSNDFLGSQFLPEARPFEHACNHKALAIKAFVDILAQPATVRLDLNDLMNCAAKSPVYATALEFSDASQLANALDSSACFPFLDDGIYPDRALIKLSGASDQLIHTYPFLQKVTTKGFFSNTRISWGYQNGIVRNRLGLTLILGGLTHGQNTA